MFLTSWGQCGTPFASCQCVGFVDAVRQVTTAAELDSILRAARELLPFLFYLGPSVLKGKMTSDEAWERLRAVRTVLDVLPNHARLSCPNLFTVLMQKTLSRERAPEFMGVVRRAVCELSVDCLVAAVRRAATPTALDSILRTTLEFSRSALRFETWIPIVIESASDSADLRTCFCDARRVAVQLNAECEIHEVTDFEDTLKEAIRYELNGVRYRLEWRSGYTSGGSGPGSYNGSYGQFDNGSPGEWHPASVTVHPVSK